MRSQASPRPTPARSSPRRCRTPGCWPALRWCSCCSRFPCSGSTSCSCRASCAILLSAAHHRLRGGKLASVAGMGVLSAIIVSPCVAAPLAGALLYISQTRDVALGGSALFAMALGMGIPLLAIGVSGGALLPSAGRWMNVVNKFFGVLLLAVAAWIVSPLFLDGKGDTKFVRVDNVAELDAKLAAPGKPVMLDFYADWCVSCKEMEAFTFSDARVKAKFERMLPAAGRRHGEHRCAQGAAQALFPLRPAGHHLLRRAGQGAARPARDRLPERRTLPQDPANSPRPSEGAMQRHLQGIDHVVVLVRDLDKAQHAYARMGFTLTPRGLHTLGSQNHCLMFGSDYVELLAVPRPHPAIAVLHRFPRQGRRAWARSPWPPTTRTDCTPASLRRASWRTRRSISRDRCEGLGDARFRIVQLPPDASPGCRMFACQHFTREVVWRPQYQRHRERRCGNRRGGSRGRGSRGGRGELRQAAGCEAAEDRRGVAGADRQRADRARLALEDGAPPARRWPATAAAAAGRGAFRARRGSRACGRRAATATDWTRLRWRMAPSP